MPEKPSIPEPARTPELPSHSPLMGLQGRLEMGGPALDPNTLQLTMQKEDLGKNNPATYELMHRASLRERDSYWKEQSIAEFDAQMTAWRTSLTDSITDRSSYFRTNEKGKQQARFFAKMDIDVADFTIASAQRVYDKYCAGDAPEDNLVRFAEDVVSACTRQDGTIDTQALRTALPAAHWLANIFGSSSSEILTQMIDAEAARRTKPEEFATTASHRINELSTTEKNLLSFLTGIPVTQAEPKPPPPNKPITPPEPPRDDPDKITPPHTPIEVPEPKKYAPDFIPLFPDEPDFVIEHTDLTDNMEIKNNPAIPTVVGKTQDGRDIKVSIGIPDTESEAMRQYIQQVNPDSPIQFLAPPASPHVLTVDHLNLRDRDHAAPIELENVCVVFAHGYNTGDGTWHFLDGQKVYQTIQAYNTYAKTHGLRPIEFIVSCNKDTNDHSGKVKIIGWDSGHGYIGQSENKEIGVSVLYDKKAGTMTMDASVLDDGNFSYIDDVVGRRKKKTTTD